MMIANQEAAKEQDFSLVVAALNDTDRALLAGAYESLEHPGLASRLGSIVGSPIEIGFHLLPRQWYRRLHTLNERIILTALSSVISTLDKKPSVQASAGYHKALSFATGGVSGLFGLPALLVELPITTTLMLRSIADIAQSYGEDLSQTEPRLACLQVFALSGRTHDDDATESGYYGVRLAMSISLFNASDRILKHGLEQSPVMIKMVSFIAQRFGVQVQQKAAAKMVPVVGAVSSAVINVIFMQHFQQIAHAHFAIRSLERKYGKALVQAEYEKLAANDKDK